MDILEKLKKRYATKQFSDQKIDEKNLNIILESARLSASSFGLQPYKLVIVENETIRQQLQKASYDQPQVTQASHVLIFAALRNVDQSTTNDYLDLVSSVRSIERASLKPYEAMINAKVDSLIESDKIRYWVNRQIYIALGSVLETAALIDVDACPMEGFSTDEVDKILGLEALELRSVVMCTLGYRSSEDSYQFLEKVRKSSESFYVKI